MDQSKNAHGASGEKQAVKLRVLRATIERSIATGGRYSDAEVAAALEARAAELEGQQRT